MKKMSVIEQKEALAGVKRFKCKYCGTNIPYLTFIGKANHIAWCSLTHGFGAW